MMPQTTKTPGKRKAGWLKVGLYLSPDAARRLDLATISKQADRSEIVTNLLLSQLPNYVISARVASKVSELPDGQLNLIGASAR
jgi:hypothetical protein